MSPFKTALYLLIASVLMTSCGDTSKKSNHGFSLSFKDDAKKIPVASSLGLIISNQKQQSVDSVVYFVDDIRWTSANLDPITIDFKDGRVGQRQITAQIYSGATTYTTSKNIILLANQAPEVYEYTILETYPHDRTAFTQGIEFVGDTLYESTGKTGLSTLRKVDYTTGEVIQNVNLGPQFFGEGLTVKDGKVYQLTWKRNIGMVYNATTLEKERIFNYNKSLEGWGLCNDGSTIYKSDGTQRIWTLDSNNLLESGYIEVYTHTSKIDQINELEYIEGKIYANVWQKDAIAIINPNTGVVEGIINTKTLKDQVTQHEDLDVLNGIAYKGEPGIIYLTGKNWDKLFKVQISLAQ